MSSIINAGVDGIVLTASSTAALNVQVGGTNAIQIGTGATTTISNATITSLTISNPSVFPAGSASAPAVTTTGDTNTGIYFPAADQVAVTTGGTVAAAFNSNGLFFRNRIINGDMRIDQRLAGAVSNPSGTSYTVDRWAARGSVASKFTLQQSTTVPTGAGFINSIIATSSSAYTVGASEVFNIAYFIEGTNVADLGWGTASARTVTLSFWVRSSLTGTFGGSLRNSAANRSYPFSYTISVADTWEYKTITIPGDTTGTWLTDTGIGISVFISLGAGATLSGTAGAWAGSNFQSATGAVSVVGTNGATFYITGVQLETGSVATPFERRPYGTELMLCQRYYERLNSQYMAFIANASYLSNPYSIFQFLVQKRAAPTLSTVTGASLTNLLDRFGIGLITPTASTTNNITAFSCRVEFTTSASYTVGESFSVVNDYWQASAEL